MKLFKQLIVVIVHTSWFTIIPAPTPLQKAEHDLRYFRMEVGNKIDALRNQLLEIVTMLTDQQKEAQALKTDLITKQSTIDSSSKSLEAVRQDANQNKLLPKDVKAPLNEMFDSSGQLLNQINNVVVNAVKTATEVDALIPDTINKIKIVVQEIDKYAKLITQGLKTASDTMMTLVDAEIKATKAAKAIEKGAQQAGQAIVQTAQQAGKAIEQTAQQAGKALQQVPTQIGQSSQQLGQTIGQSAQQTGKAIEYRAQQAGKAIEQTAQDAGQAISQTAQQAGSAIAQTAQQAGSAIVQGGQQVGTAFKEAPAKIEQGLKDFGKLLGIG